MELDKLVGHSVKQNASDLHLCPGRPPIIRVDGLRRQLEAPALAESDIAGCARRYLDALQNNLLVRGGQSAAALTLTGGQRLRAHFFLQQGGLAVSLRIIPSRPPSMAEPEMQAAGEMLSQPRALHIITLEDPHRTPACLQALPYAPARNRAPLR